MLHEDNVLLFHLPPEPAECLESCVVALHKLLQVTKDEKKELFDEEEAQKVFLQVFI